MLLCLLTTFRSKLIRNRLLCAIILTLTMELETPEPSTEATEGAEGGQAGAAVDPKSLCGFKRHEAVLQDLIGNSVEVDGTPRLNFGAKTRTAEKFGISERTVYSIWQEALASIAYGAPWMQLEDRTSRCGRKRKEVDLSNIESIPLQQQEMIRSTAHALGVTTWQVWRSSWEGRRGEEGRIRPTRSVLKPALQEFHHRD